MKKEYSMDTPWDSMVISNLCSVWRGWEGADNGVIEKENTITTPRGSECRKPHLKVVKELFEGHLFTIRL